MPSLHPVRRPAARGVPVQRAARTHRRLKAERPSQLLDAALDEFVEKGFAAARAEDVAARAGVSKGTLYLYYVSKEALLMAVIEHHLSTPIADCAESAAAHRGAVTPVLQRELAGAWLRLLDSPASAVVKIVFTEARQFPDIAAYYAQHVVEPAQRLIGGLIERGIARREFRRVHVPDAVRSVMSPLLMLCLHKHSIGACAPGHQHDDVARFVDNHLGLVLRGLAAAPATSHRASAAEATAPSRGTGRTPALPRRSQPKRSAP